MVIYADVIFAVNFMSSYIILYILGKTINKVRIRKKRSIAASLAGGIAAVLIFCIDMPAWSAYISQIVSVFIMIFIAFFDLRKRILYQFGWFMLMCGIMMFSMIFAASLLGKTVGIVSKAGILYFDISPKIFLVSFLAAYLMMILFIKLFKNRKNKKYYMISVTHNNRTVTVTALFDSGNLLKEPITGKYVSIIEWEKVRELFDSDCEFSDLEKHIEEMKLWIIPFNSLGNPTGTLFGFQADSLSIPEEKKTIDKTFIGLYGRKLSKSNDYHALINAGLL